MILVENKHRKNMAQRRLERIADEDHNKILTTLEIRGLLNKLNYPRIITSSVNEFEVTERADRIYIDGNKAYIPFKLAEKYLASIK